MNELVGSFGRGISQFNVSERWGKEGDSIDYPGSFSLSSGNVQGICFRYFRAASVFLSSSFSPPIPLPICIYTSSFL